MIFDRELDVDTALRVSVESDARTVYNLINDAVTKELEVRGDVSFVTKRYLQLGQVAQTEFKVWQYCWCDFTTAFRLHFAPATLANIFWVVLNL